MKKFLIIILSIISISSFYYLLPKTINATEYTDEYIPRYETWENDMTDDELVQYYIDNDIRPANAPADATKILYERNVADHLHGRFSQYSNWSKSNNKGYVSDVYGHNPVEIDEDSNFIQKAKENAGIEYNYIGCGPLSMVTQFEYLARYAGYSSISSKLEAPEIVENAPARTLLAKEIFENTNTISSDSILGQIFGFDSNEGTLTFPSEVIKSSREILENHYLSIKKTREVVNDDGTIKTETYYDNDSMIIVNGDSIPCLSTFSTKINNLKDSIDRGMPIIWWTLGESMAGDFGNHYMNIFGYEYWTGTDSSGNTKTHLMFILRPNWGYEDVYMDSDVLDAVNGGFIFFEETHDKTLIKPSDYNYECQYYFDEKEKLVAPSLGNSFSTKYLRTGYVNRYDNTNTTIIDNQLVLSAKRKNAGVAYIEYKFDKPIEWIYIETNWWRPADGIDYTNGYALIQYKNQQGQWITQFDLLNDIIGGLSISIDYPSKIKCQFETPITEFRIYVSSNNATGDRNKGRLVVGDIMVVFDN